MSPGALLQFILLGSATGLLSGYLGIGGGVILVPVLSEIFLQRGMPLDQVMTSAFATSLFTAVFTTGASALQQFRQRNLVPAAVPWAAAGAVIGSQGGAWLGSNLEGGILHTAFGGFLLLAAVNLGVDWRRGRAAGTPRIGWLPLTAVGAVTGLLAALFGVGGGIVMVPAFIILLNLPAGRVAGTSSAVAFLLTVSGVIGYLLYGAGRAGTAPGFWGVIDLSMGIPIAAGTLSSAWLGARFNKRFGGRAYRRAFAVFLALVALRMLLR